MSATERSAWRSPKEPTPEQTSLAAELPHLVLASGSPARKALLVNAGIDVTVSPTDADEQVPQTVPHEKVMAIALRKMEAYLNRQAPVLPVLTCDTMIAFNGMMIGKPADREQAFEQLSSFNGTIHEVYTGWALAFRTGTLGLVPQVSDSPSATEELSNRYFIENRPENDVTVVWYYDHARVEFYRLSDSDIQAYLDCNEWKGAAGSYRIQGEGGSLIRSIHGDYATVVGLPISMISGIVTSTALS